MKLLTFYSYCLFLLTATIPVLACRHLHNSCLLVLWQRVVPQESIVRRLLANKACLKDFSRWISIVT